MKPLLGLKPRLSGFASLEWDSRFTFLMNSPTVLRLLVWRPHCEDHGSRSALGLTRTPVLTTVLLVAPAHQQDRCAWTCVAIWRGSNLGSRSNTIKEEVKMLILLFLLLKRHYLPGLWQFRIWFRNFKLACDLCANGASLVAQAVKNLPALLETWVQFLGWEEPVEEDMATHSSIFTWRMPWTEDPGGMQSMGS